MNNVWAALVITKAQLKLEPTSAQSQWARSSCTPRPMAGPGTLAHNRLKGGPEQKKESMDLRAAEVVIPEKYAAEAFWGIKVNEHICFVAQ